MRHELPEDITSLVKLVSVHRSLYDDPAIFELELERIFGRAWIYVGHESQVRGPGDYFCTQVGRKPIVVVRGPDRALHVLHNQCAHRGAMVVALDKGKGSARLVRAPTPWARRSPAPATWFNKRARPSAVLAIS